MRIDKGMVLRLYPNKKQQILIEKTLGCCRLVHNKLLHKKQKLYKNNKINLSYNDMSSILTKYKESTNYKFLNEVDSIALQQGLRDLDISYKNFFNGSGFPKYKSKKGYQSYRTINQNNSIRFVGKYIKLPKLGFVKVKQTFDLSNCKIKSATVSKDCNNHYYVSLHVIVDVDELPKVSKNIGIDLGLKEFLVTSDGDFVDNKKFTKTSEIKLARANKKFSKKKINSKNFEKQRLKLNKIYSKVSNQRKDFLHKESLKLINENQVIFAEDLKVKNLLRNHKLAKAISDVSWSEFIRLVGYKAKWYGRTFIQVPTNFPSSQLCSVCNYQNKDTKNLKIRKWTCPNCGSTHDRDINAAINILNKGLEILNNS